MRWKLMYITLVLIVSSYCLANTPIKSHEELVGEANETGNVTKHEDEDDGHDHGGVHLVTVKWEEYRGIIIFLLMIIIVGILKIAFHHIPILNQNLPESCVLIAIGIVVGVVVYMLLDSQSAHFPSFSSALFFNVLLPPIILDSAYTLYDRDFLANFLSVILYAVVGTLFNVFCIGYLLYFVNYMGWMGTFQETLDPIRCLVFSSLISAVDPVAVLAIFEEIGVNMGLYFLVFGESLLNDGVTVVLYNTMLALSELETIDPLQYVFAFLSFFTVVFGGLAIGCLVGGISAFILKFTDHTRVIQPLIVFATAYLAFILAETFHWSGIISLIGCGVTQKRYAFPNISKKSYTTVKYSVKTMAAFSDCVIFLFLGIVTISKTLDWQTGFVLWTIGICLVVRFVGVFVLTYFINKRRVKIISFREQIIMAYGGLRGAVGFSLALILPQDYFKPIFLAATLAMIFFTVFLQGSTIKFLVGVLNIERKGSSSKMIGNDVNEKTIDHVMAGIESIIGKYSRRRLLQRIREFDDHYTKKLLIRKNVEDMLALRFERITLDEHYARLYGPTVIIHEKGQNTATGSDVTKELTEDERKKLQKALSNTAFSKFLRKDIREDSPDILENIQKETENNFNLLQRSLILRQRRRRNLSSDEEDENDHSNFKEAGKKEEGRSMLKNKSSNLDAKTILDRYKSAKNEFKHSNDEGSLGRATSMEVKFNEKDQETSL